MTSWFICSAPCSIHHTFNNCISLMIAHGVIDNHSYDCISEHDYGQRKDNIDCDLRLMRMY